MSIPLLLLGPGLTQVYRRITMRMAAGALQPVALALQPLEGSEVPEKDPPDRPGTSTEWVSTFNSIMDQ